ncbi:non-ribosomal peptide synthetase [Kordia sp.]|uniref:non-ribosomal peptide synthetase n=1 Tax=Kordia sp. TaxID=1965332 RepID=UPI0025C57EA0|nr:non-ribosomal peptide synthetase [Kordia sp.]MCH2195462.1 amino acid adenylation domain-containing protein [Kordia sp.]
MIDFIKNLSDQGIYLRLKDGKLKLSFEGDMNPDILQSVKAKKEEIISYLENHSLEAVAESNTIESVQTEDNSYPISDAQRRLWVLSQYDGGSVAYNIPSSIPMPGEYDIESLQKAINAVIDRHEILRTVFREDENGEVKQWVLNREDIHFNIEYKDFRNETDKAIAVENYIRENSSKEFDLVNGPLLRVALIQTQDKEYVFYYNMHHIISDGWSMEILRENIMVYYEAFVSNTTPAIADLSVQYKDYASWQLKQLETETFQKHKSYWLNSLSGKLPVLDMPSTKLRPKIQTYNGYVLNTFIDTKTSNLLRAYSKENGGSLFISLLAVFKVLLYKYTNQKDIIIGSPVAGREHTNLQDQIGFYVNTLALRNQIDPTESFNTFYKRIKQNTLEAYNHQMYPFDRLVEDLKIKKDVTRGTIFDLMLVLQNNGENRVELGFSEEQLNTVIELGHSRAKFDLSATFEEMGVNISFDLEYNTDIYDKEIIERMMQHYKKLMRSLLTQPNESISQIDFVSEQEKQILTSVFNNTEADYPTNNTIVDVFKAQVQKTPNNIALVFENCQLTYKQLDEKSNQLARFLAANYEINTEDFISIQLDRSEWMIVAILAVLKTGAAYVPVQPDYPQERIDYIEKDTQCKAIINQALLAQFQAGQYSSAPVEVTVQPENLAYIIYTSGSTGTPKGVMLEHKTVVNLAYAQIQEFGITAEENILQSSSITFDASVEQMFIALLSGAKLSVASKALLLDTERLADYIENNAITHIHSVPSFLKLIPRRNYSALKRVISGGDNCSVELAKSWAQNNVRFYNEYGPTETTITAIESYYTEDMVARRGDMPIGKPLSNYRVYILDEFLNIAPVGVMGEICISGDVLARGYLNLPEVTAEKFIDNPFENGKKLYKTGDLGKWMDDGSIEFIGRKDNQVKVRGYRIELGEIEDALTQIQTIKSTVVLAKETLAGEKELVAYFTSDTEFTSEDLRDELNKKLPNYMIPAYYVQLEEFPLTATGKIDRKNLPNPKNANLSSGDEYVAPRNEMETQIVDIWQEILQLDKVGVEEDFFRLGASSLKSIRLVNMYNKIFGVKVSLKDIFSYTDIESHVRLIKSSKQEKYIEIEKVAEAKNYPISFEQKRIWLLSQDDKVSIAYNMPTTLEFEGEMNLEYFERAVRKVLERHEALRTVFREEEEGDVKQWIIPMEEFKFTIDYKNLQEEKYQFVDVEAYLKAKFYTPFDLQNGPLVRVGFFQIEANKFILYYCMHHLINDGASMEILGDEVSRYYQLIEDGKSIEETPLRIQYKDYVAWQLKMFETDAVNDISDYWKETFQNKVNKVHLPFEKKRPENFQSNGNIIQFELTKEIKDGLQQMATNFDGSMYISSIFLINTLLYQYLGDQNIMVGSSFSTRTHEELTRQIGFYVNNLPVVAKAEASLSLQDFYNQIKNTVLTINSNAWYPLEKVIEDANYTYDASYSGLFNVLVEYHTKNGTTELTDEEVFYNETQYTYNVPCQFDISLEFFENDQKISCVLTYNNTLYDESQIELLKDRLEKIAETLTQSIETLDTLTLGSFQYEETFEPDMDFSDALFASLEENF